MRAQVIGAVVLGARDGVVAVRVNAAGAALSFAAEGKASCAMNGRAALHALARAAEEAFAAARSVGHVGARACAAVAFVIGAWIEIIAVLVAVASLRAVVITVPLAGRLAGLSSLHVHKPVAADRFHANAVQADHAGLCDANRAVGRGQTVNASLRFQVARLLAVARISVVALAARAAFPWLFGRVGLGVCGVLAVLGAGIIRICVTGACNASLAGEEDEGQGDGKDSSHQVPSIHEVSIAGKACEGN